MVALFLLSKTMLTLLSANVAICGNLTVTRIKVDRVDDSLTVVVLNVVVIKERTHTSTNDAHGNRVIT